MMPSTSTSLTESLTQALTGSPKATPSPDQEATIDLLHDTMSGYELGSYTLGEVKDIFDANPVPGFDILLWIKSKEETGEYEPQSEVDE